MRERKAKRRAIREGEGEEGGEGAEDEEGRRTAPSGANLSDDGPLFPPSTSSSPPSQLESATTTSKGALLPRAMAAAALVAQTDEAG